MYVSKDHSFYWFDNTLEPAVVVDTGVHVILEVEVTLPEIIETGKWPVDQDFDAIVRVTGPVGIAGAEPGDTLVVEVVEVSLHEWAWSAVIEGFGPLGSSVRESRVAVVRIDGAIAHIGERVVVCNPFPGTIGVAPLGDRVNARWPGLHGGNMDNPQLTAGSRLFLPVSASGALFGVADIHGAMGYGEVSGTAIECGAEVTVRFDVLKKFTFPSPVVERRDTISFVASAEFLDEAVKDAATIAVQFLEEIEGIDHSDALMLTSNVGNIDVLQVVNPLKSCAVRLPKSVFRNQKALKEIGFRYGGGVLQ